MVAPGHDLIRQSILVGVSSSVLGPDDDLERLVEFQPDVIEWYGLPSSQLEAIARLSAEHAVRTAVHGPLPYDGPRPPYFAPTSADPDLAERALSLVRESVACARDLDAMHLVLHFPDPNPPYVRRGFEARATAFLDEVAELSAFHRMPVLLENMTPNPMLRSPDHYRAVLDRYPEFGLCFDLGHAHLTTYPVEEYVETLADRIGSVHVYNTTPSRYGGAGHEPIAEDQDAAEGWLDWRAVLLSLLEITSPRALVVEHDGRHGPKAAVRAVAELRAVASRGRSDPAAAS
jgi:sugar phosphate isomerase/epimerase